MPESDLAESIQNWIVSHRESGPMVAIIASSLSTDQTTRLGEFLTCIHGLQIRSATDFGFDAGTLQAAFAAILGTMHIDQMPANLTWLTGADVPRILGRLTPGSSTAWRRLLREMADYHPAAMRLRDVV